MKNRRAITLLLTANFVSGVAQGISMIAVPLHFAKTQQSNWFAAGYMLVTLFTLFWAPYAGVLVDKYDRKKVFIVLMGFMGIALTGIAAASFIGGINNWLAFGAFALTFWNFSLHYVCFYAFMQEITEKEHYNKIASILEVQGQLASALAGAGAALLLDPTTAAWLGIAVWELPQIFALDAFTYFLGLGIILLMRFVPLSTRKSENGSLWKRLSVGFSYLKSEPYIFLFGIISQAVFITVLIHVFELSPIYVQNHLAPTDGSESSIFATSELLYSLGAVVAGLAIQLIFRRSTFVAAIIILSFITLLEYSSLVVSKSIWLFWVVSFLLGITNAGIRVIRVSYLFKVIPNQVIGRANSIFGLGNTLIRILFLGLFALPFFHEQNQIIYSFVVMVGFLAVAMVLLMLFYNKMVIRKDENSTNS